MLAKSCSISTVGRNTVAPVIISLLLLGPPLTTRAYRISGSGGKGSASARYTHDTQRAGNNGAPCPEVEMLPIHLSISLTVMIAGESAQVAIDVAAVPPGGGYVQLMVNPASALESPAGSWPLQVDYPSGSPTSQTLSITAGDVLLPEFATIYAGDADADPNDPDDWTAVGEVLVAP